MPKRPNRKVAVAYCLHDDVTFLDASIRSFASAGDLFGFVSEVPWHGEPGDYQQAVRIISEAGGQVFTDAWKSEDEHRRAALEQLRHAGYRFVFIPDGDEVIERCLLNELVAVASAELADLVCVEWDTYWKSPEYVIRPRERFTPPILIDLQSVVHRHLRNFQGQRPLLLPASHGLIHHLSYVGPDQRIERKIRSWSHREEVREGWLDEVWRAWDEDQLLRNLHPTHPEAYQFAERIAPPPELAEVPAPTRVEPLPVKDWPTISVVIPVCDGLEHLEACLESLDRISNILHEVIVVDNGSKEPIAEAALRHRKVAVHSLPENRGFPAACNVGIASASGEVIVLLNSDAIVPKAGLVALIHALQSSANVAAAGPLTNNAGHGQQVLPTYTSEGTIELFAEDFAGRSEADEEVDMLVGFCLAIRRPALDEIGPLDERFGLGTFDDNDLCYRLRRAGYRLLRANKAFVHHTGSQTFARLGIDARSLLLRNQRLFEQKWQEDLELGYASHLSGLGSGAIRFDPARKPEVWEREIARLARQADVSLCMIVRDEERVIGECLTSARPYFREMIVVDTGSSDRTKEIASSLGASVYDFPWTDSFSEARNESLRHARGKWIFWMDADDTLPKWAGEDILRSAINAPADVVAFVVPVQFVDDGPGAGTRVDHVKLCRNFEGIGFEGRIHEQVLPSLRRHGGKIARARAYVLHSGYDTSEAGQKKKRGRDDKLLKLDLKDRPGHPFVLFNLGMTAHYTERHQEAVMWLAQSIAASEPTDSHVRKAIALKAVSLRQLGKDKAAIKEIEDGLKHYPDDPELHFHAGLILTATGEVGRARRHYLAATEASIEGHFSSVDLGIMGFKAFHNLAGLELAEGNYQEARSWYQRSIAGAPHHLPSYVELFHAALTEGDTETATGTLDAILQQHGPCEAWADLGRQFCQKHGDPIAFLSRAVTDFPDSPGPALVLSRLLLDSGQVSQAEPLLDHLRALKVAEGPYMLGVSAIRQGLFPEALIYMLEALELNPGHTQTEEQVANLRRLLAGEGGAGTPKPRRKR